MIDIFSLKANNIEEFQQLTQKMTTTLDKWNKKFPKFDYAFVGSTETFEISIEVKYNHEDNSEDNSHISETNSTREELNATGNFRDSDFSI